MVQPERYHSGIVKFDLKKARFTLPADILRSAGWPELKDGEVLIIEFRNRGHYRLLRKAEADAAIVIAEQRASYHDDSELADATRQILADRFRRASYYKKDNNRLWVGTEVMFGLFGPPPYTDSMFIYLQAATGAIDVMTDSFRIHRLTQSLLDD